MILPFSDKKPELSQSCFIAPTADVIGDVTAAAQSSIWYGAVLRADTGRIVIGAGSNVQDNAVLHTGPGLDVTLGENVTVGHSAVVHGCTVGDGSLIGMHATLMNGCRIGKGCIIAAGALVAQGMEVPDGMLAVGVPAKIKGPVREDALAQNLSNAEHYRALGAAHRAALCREAAKPHLQNL